MKKIIFTAGLYLAVLMLKAQVKVWSGGTTVVGSTSSTSLTGHKMRYF